MLFFGGLGLNFSALNAEERATKADVDLAVNAEELVAKRSGQPCGWERT
jgi:hypothetical protein